MTTFLWVMVALFATSIVGKALMLKDHDFVSKPSHMCADIAAQLLLLIWAVYLLGGLK